MLVRNLARNVIQTGGLATIWAVSALVSWFWLERNIIVYRVFDITSGTVYAHVSVSPAAGPYHLKGNNHSGDI
jgi:hypothetical protein